MPCCPSATAPTNAPTSTRGTEANLPVARQTHEAVAPDYMAFEVPPSPPSPPPVIQADGPISDKLLDFTTYCVTQVVAMNEMRAGQQGFMTPPEKPSVVSTPNFAPYYARRCPLGVGGQCIGTQACSDRAAIALAADAAELTPAIGVCPQGCEVMLVHDLLAKLRSQARLRLSELLTAVVYIDTLSRSATNILSHPRFGYTVSRRRYWNGGRARLCLNRSNLSPVLLLSVMVAHKVSAQRTSRA